MVLKATPLCVIWGCMALEPWLSAPVPIAEGILNQEAWPCKTNFSDGLLQLGWFCRAVLMHSDTSLFVLYFWMAVVVLEGSSLVSAGHWLQFPIFQWLWWSGLIRLLFIDFWSVCHYSMILSGSGGLEILLFCVSWPFTCNFCACDSLHVFKLSSFATLFFWRKW